MEATASIRFSHLRTSTSLPSSLLSPPFKPLTPKPSLSSLNLAISIPAPHIPLKCLLYRSTGTSIKPTLKLHCSAEEVAVLEDPNETQDVQQKKKLYVVNLPWSMSVGDLKNAFSECGTVTDVELIKNNNGKSRGYAFVTMASGDEAQAVIDKFDSTEFSGRTIRVEYARTSKKPRPQPPAAVPIKDTQYKLYVSNLQWKVRSNHLREFFSANFNPVSSRVIFESPSGRAAGYGFVRFGTREEAEAAITALDGKQLMGRPVRLKLSDRNTEESVAGEKEEVKDDLEESVTGTDEEEVPAEQPENS